VLAYVSRVRDIGCDVDDSAFTMADVEANIARCPDQEAAQKMIDGEWLGVAVFVVLVWDRCRRSALGVCADASPIRGFSRRRRRRRRSLKKRQNKTPPKTHTP